MVNIQSVLLVMKYRCDKNCSNKNFSNKNYSIKKCSDKVLKCKLESFYFNHLSSLDSS